jgi:hypothetical protein
LSGVSFTDTSTANGGSLNSWNWDFGNDASPSSSTATNPTDIVFGSGGTKSVQLIATSDKGCQDSVTHNITIYNRPTDTIDPVACDSYTAPSGTEVYTSSGTYVDTVLSGGNCDSFITINLTIKQSSSQTISRTACDSYLVPSGDTSYTQSGTYNDTIPNAAGCDSVLTINLLVKQSSRDTLYPTVCDSFTVPSGNQVYSSSGVYYDTLTNMTGCDSILRIELNVPSYQLSGKVFQPNNDTISNTTIVYAIELDSNRLPIGARGIDTLDDRATYQFSLCGTYIILAQPVAPAYDQFMPTYYDNALRWNGALPISLNQDTPDININLDAEKLAVSGPGTIEGRIIEGAGYGNKRTKGDPLANINCGIVEQGRDSIYQYHKDSIYQYTTTDSVGQFAFNNAEQGRYHLYADVPGKKVDTYGRNDCKSASSGTHYDEVIIAIDSQQVQVIYKRVDSSTDIAPPVDPLQLIKIYPNPTRNNVSVKIKHQAKQPQVVFFALYTISGKRMLYRAPFHVKPGTNILTLPLNEVSAGPLLLEMQTKEGQCLDQRVIIKVK